MINVMKCCKWLQYFNFKQEDQQYEKLDDNDNNNNTGSGTTVSYFQLVCIRTVDKIKSRSN